MCTGGKWCMSELSKQLIDWNVRQRDNFSIDFVILWTICVGQSMTFFWRRLGLCVYCLSIFVQFNLNWISFRVNWPVSFLLAIKCAYCSSRTDTQSKWWTLDTINRSNQTHDVIIFACCRRIFMAFTFFLNFLFACPKKTPPFRSTANKVISFETKGEELATTID